MSTCLPGRSGAAYEAGCAGAMGGRGNNKGGEQRMKKGTPSGKGGRIEMEREVPLEKLPVPLLEIKETFPAVKITTGREIVLGRQDLVESFSIVRDGYEQTMWAFYQKTQAEFLEKAEQTGEHRYTEHEALMLALVSFLLPDRKCRAVMEYDPAARRVKFFREDVQDEPKCGSQEELGRNLQNTHSPAERTG